GQDLSFGFGRLDDVSEIFFALGQLCFRHSSSRLLCIAIAAGVAGVFMETHPNPPPALYDGPNSVPQKYIKQLLTVLKKLDIVTKASGFLENQMNDHVFE
ncbi:MAG: hypothetical protein NWS57_01100, partial [Burkholderiaceae bacterium]|nr:hypothetical protein [Burkholderiaceae bacterium]